MGQLHTCDFVAPKGGVEEGTQGGTIFVSLLCKKVQRKCNRIQITSEPQRRAYGYSLVCYFPRLFVHMCGANMCIHLWPSSVGAPDATRAVQFFFLVK